MKNLGCLSALLAALAMHPPAVQAQDHDGLVEEPDDHARLRAWLELAADRENDRELIGALLTAGGVGVFGGAIATGAIVLADGGDAAFHLALPLALGFVGLQFAIGGIWMLAENPESRFRQALARERWSERDVGRYEGWLQERADVGRAQRVAATISGAAMAIAGLTGGVALLATESPFEAYVLDYAFAVGFFAGGLLGLVMSLFESEAEADWREYRAGFRPDRPRASVSFDGLGLRGRF